MPARTHAINPRKKPLQSRSAATVDAILEAAARILEKGGLAAFNTNAIAEKAGVSVGSVYQYFPGKEALLAALIRRKRASLLQDMQSVSTGDSAGDLRQATDAFIAVALTHGLARPALSRALEYAEATLRIDTETRQLKQGIISAVAKVLSAHGVRDPLTAARDISAMTRGMMDGAGLFGETAPASLERRVRRAVYGYLGLNRSLSHRRGWRED